MTSGVDSTTTGGGIVRGVSATNGTVVMEPDVSESVCICACMDSETPTSRHNVKATTSLQLQLLLLTGTCNVSFNDVLSFLERRWKISVDQHHIECLLVCQFHLCTS